MSIKVYLSKIPQKPTYRQVFPTIRQEYIKRAKNENVKAERFCVWQLLSYALSDCRSVNIKQADFKRLSNGRWVTGVAEISLSHFGGYVCVGVSNSPIGVDICRPSDRFNVDLYNYLTTDNEKAFFGKAPPQKTVAEIFSVKEAVFKRDEGFKTIKECPATDANTKVIYLKEEDLLLAVAFSKRLDTDSDIQIKRVEYDIVDKNI